MQSADVSKHMTVNVGRDLQNVTFSLANNLTAIKPIGFGAVHVQSGDTIAYGDADDDLKSAGVVSLFVMNLRASMSGEISDLSYSAFEAYFHMCVNTYEVQITDNVPNTTVVHSSVKNGSGEEIFVKVYNGTYPAAYLTTPKDPGVKYPLSGMANDTVASVLSYSVAGAVPIFYAPPYGNNTQAIAGALHPSQFYESSGFDTSIPEELQEAEYQAMTNVSRNIASMISTV